MKNVAVRLTTKPDALSYQEAMSSPCLSCETSPCCSYLPLHTFQVRTLTDFDQAVYLLNFDRIELGLSASGDWSVYYRYPCRFLDRSDFSCTVHATPQQPNICVHYNPYGCWYRRSLVGPGSDEFLRVDRTRLEYIAERLVFDDARRITYAPPWEELSEAFAALPLRQGGDFDDLPPADPGLPEWEAVVLGTSTSAVPSPVGFDDPRLRTPCDGCQAYCCDTLAFPLKAPDVISGLDYVQFALGFPGIQVGIADEGWSLLVKTRCRHLEGNRCGVYGKAERPLRCRYYDEWTCTYKRNLDTPRPEAFVRVALEHFGWLAECYAFDAEGQAREVPNADAIRGHIEARWAEHGPLYGDVRVEAIQ